MKKAGKSVYSCTECGQVHSKWNGKCSGCGAWNTLVETVASTSPRSLNSWTGSSGSEAQLMSEVENGGEVSRFSTGLAELDRVLGGGLVEGSVVLIGGDPGIGKSTLILQACAEFSKSVPVLYCTGEESPRQVSDRARRLGLIDSKLLLAYEIECEKIIALAKQHGAKVLVVDSIQTVFTGTLESAPGSVAQVRESAAALTRIAKSNGVSVILVGHVTKESTLAGPRVLEHMVDAVLSFEGDEGQGYRLLRANKNRYGGASEIGIFSMGSKGLQDVTNSSDLFVTAHPKPVAGSVIHAAMEGTRPFLVEVQALVEDTCSPNPKRFASGFETSRLQLLLAVLNKHANLQAFDKNVYLKVVGGVRLLEPASDLSALMASYSSIMNKPLPSGLIVFGEVGLAGEIRSVQSPEVRLKEAAKIGYTSAIIPASSKIETVPKEITNLVRISSVSQLPKTLAAFS